MITPSMTDAEIYENIIRNDFQDLINHVKFDVAISALNKITKGFKRAIEFLNDNRIVSRRTYVSKKTKIEYYTFTFFNQSIKDEIYKALHKKDIHAMVNNVASVYSITYTIWKDASGRDNYLMQNFDGPSSAQQMKIFNISPHMMSRYRSRMEITDDMMKRLECRNIFEYFILNEIIYTKFGANVIPMSLKEMNDDILQKPELWFNGVIGNSLHDEEDVFYINAKHGVIVTKAVRLDGVTDDLSTNPKFLVFKTFITVDAMSPNTLYFKEMLDTMHEDVYKATEIFG